MELGGLGFSYEMAELRHRFPQSLPQLHRESQRHVCPTIVLHRNALSRVELLYSFSYASHQPGFAPCDLGASCFWFSQVTCVSTGALGSSLAVAPMS